MLTNEPTIDSGVMNAIAWARQFVGQAAFAGKCLSLVRQAWGAQGMGGTAAQAWVRAQQAGGAHTDGSAPPLGAAVFFTGGSSGAGHTAIVSKYVNGQAYIITNDYPTKGQVGEVPLAQLQKAWGNLHYVGWSSSVNGKTILKGSALKAPADGATIDPVEGAHVPSNYNVTTPTASSADVAAYLQANFGLTDAVLALDKSKGKNLRWAFNYIVSHKITDPNRAANVLSQTTWFKTNGVEVTKRLAQEKTGPGDFTRSVDEQLSTIRDRAAALGLTLDDAHLRKVARDTYVYGLNDSQIVDSLLKNGAKTNGGGTTGQAMDSINDFAYASGLKISSKDKQMWANAIAAGDKTPEDYQKMLREQSAQTYSVFADQIRGGQNLSDLTAAYRQKAANLLEMDPSEVSWDDPLFKDGKAFTTVDQKTGQPAIKTLWQFENDVKQDQRWQYTENAHNTYVQKGNDILRRFGMVA